MKRRQAPRNFSAARLKSYELKETDKAITQLVVKLENIFTSPDIFFAKQEDEAHIVPKNSEDEQESNPMNESHMYFIRNGKFTVHIKTEHLRPANIDEEAAVKPHGILIDGDHFGEISMLFDCKRTATVRSDNYGTLALLKKSSF